jgi:bacterial/archaeal transporter family protein
MTEGPLPVWLFWALLSASFAAATAILTKLGVEGVHPDVATLIRTVVVLLMLAILVSASGVGLSLSNLSGRTWLFLTLSGLATGASWLCYIRALQHGPAAQVAPVDKLSVVFVALFGVTLLGERLSAANWLGVGLIAAGAALVALK